tara:strand:- start:2267 stop:2893 length:627 start_codon:yes stop_codon:yes gene_type:complete
MNFDKFMPNLKLIPNEINTFAEDDLEVDEVEEEKKQYNSEDIFQNKEEEEVNDISIMESLNNIQPEEEEEEELPDLSVKAVKEVKPKKKRVMSEKQKEALRRGRERSLANRRKNREEKEEVKNLQRRKKELTKKKLSNEVDSLSNNISVEDAVLNGIERYDKLRKQRKAEKKKTKENEYIKSTLRSGQIPTTNITGLSKRQQLLNMLN